MGSPAQDKAPDGGWRMGSPTQDKAPDGGWRMGSPTQDKAPDGGWRMGSPTQDKAPDGGWGWVILAASFLSNLLAYGSPKSVGVLYPEWLATFHEGKGLTAWVGSVAWGAALIASPLCSACVVNFGVRPVTVFSGVMVAGGLILSAFAPSVWVLIFSYGVVVGLGCGLVYAATVTITCQYFDKRRGLALGIVMTGSSAGGFLYAACQTKLVELYGLEGCLLIVGAFSLNLMACGGLLRPLHPPGYYLCQREALQRAEDEEEEEEERASPQPEEPPQSASVAKDTLIAVEDPPSARGRRLLLGYLAYTRSTGRFLRDRIFAAFCVSFFLFCLGAAPPVVFMEDVAQSKGLVDGVGSLPLVSIVAVAMMAGMLSLGAMADLRWVNSTYLYAFTVVTAGLAVLFIPASRNYTRLQVLSAVVGFSYGNWSIIPYITARIVGIDRLTEAFGILMFFGGFGYLLGPPVIGWFYDWTQSYDLAFYLSGGCVLLGDLVLFLSALPNWERTQREGQA